MKPLLESCYQFYRPCKTGEQHCLFSVCAFYCTFLLPTCAYTATSCLACSSNKVAVNIIISILEINYSTLLTCAAPSILKDYMDTWALIWASYSYKVPISVGWANRPKCPEAGKRLCWACVLTWASRRLNFGLIYLFLHLPPTFRLWWDVKKSFQLPPISDAGSQNPTPTFST